LTVVAVREEVAQMGEEGEEGGRKQKEKLDKEAKHQNQHAARAVQSEINVSHRINEADEERGEGEEQARFLALLVAVLAFSLEAVPRAP